MGWFALQVEVLEDRYMPASGTAPTLFDIARNIRESSMVQTRELQADVKSVTANQSSGNLFLPSSTTVPRTGLVVPGIQGGQEMALTSVNFGANQSFTVTMPTGPASLSFLRAAQSGQTIPKVELFIRSSNGAICHYVFTDVRIAQFSGGRGSAEAVSDVITFSYSRSEMTYIPPRI